MTDPTWKTSYNLLRPLNLLGSEIGKQYFRNDGIGGALGNKPKPELPSNSSSSNIDLGNLIPIGLAAGSQENKTALHDLPTLQEFSEIESDTVKMLIDQQMFQDEAVPLAEFKVLGSEVIDEQASNKNVEVKNQKWYTSTKQSKQQESYISRELTDEELKTLNAVEQLREDYTRHLARREPPAIAEKPKWPSSEKKAGMTALKWLNTLYDSELAQQSIRLIDIYKADPRLFVALQKQAKQQGGEVASFIPGEPIWPGKRYIDGKTSDWVKKSSYSSELESGRMRVGDFRNIQPGIYQALRNEVRESGGSLSILFPAAQTKKIMHNRRENLRTILGDAKENDLALQNFFAGVRNITRQNIER